eukprot:1161601-Pelagomonas_calceolata.AAC.14
MQHPCPSAQVVPHPYFCFAVVLRLRRAVGAQRQSAFTSTLLNRVNQALGDVLRLRSGSNDRKAVIDVFRHATDVDLHVALAVLLVSNYLPPHHNWGCPSAMYPHGLPVVLPEMVEFILPSKRVHYLARTAHSAPMCFSYIKGIKLERLSASDS